jgi:hypothetical protein
MLGKNPDYALERVQELDKFNPETDLEETLPHTARGGQ